MQRQLGVALQELHPSAHRYFGYTRFIAGDAALCRMLKAVPALDEVIAFASYEEGVSSRMNYYPKNGVGIGKWVDGLVEQAEREGVELYTNTAVSKCILSGNSIVAVELSNGREVKVGSVVWTVPPFALIKAANLPFESKCRPNLRQMRLFHFVVDTPFLVDAFHVYCLDPEMRTFRVTLYPNIQSDGIPNGDLRCSVEVMVDDDETCEELAETIWAEIKKMQLLPKEANAPATFFQNITTGFPVMTPEFVEEMQRQHEFLTQEIQNVVLLGKASTKTFFMQDVLKEVYQTLVAENGPHANEMPLAASA